MDMYYTPSTYIPHPVAKGLPTEYSRDTDRLELLPLQCGCRTDTRIIPRQNCSHIQVDAENMFADGHAETMMMMGYCSRFLFMPRPLPLHVASHHSPVTFLAGREPGTLSL